jgi:SAM-dependent methyltransferase
MAHPPHSDDELERAREEVERAAGFYYHTPLQQGIDNRTKRFVVERCEAHIRGPRVLELGYVDPLWSAGIVARGLRLDIVEGAARHAEIARAQFRSVSGVRVFHTLFQEYVPDTAYDTILAADMLRYLPDPVAFLQTAREWMAPEGVLIATLPNSRSLHRRIGSLMSMEATPTQANLRDREVGNRRSYDRYEFRDLLLSAGLHVQDLQGCFLKPLSSAQMADWSDELLRAFRDVGDELQDYCWFMYAICHAPAKPGNAPTAGA